MTNKRNLGPVLALTGAGIAVAAVIAGFILIGGPGQARDERLDEITSNRIWNLVNLVNCAFNATGTSPITVEAARATKVPSFYPSHSPPLCGDHDKSGKLGAVENAPPEKLGDISYAVIDANHVKVCGSFRAKSRDRDHIYPVVGERFYPTLLQPHPRGIHCYELELMNTGRSPLLPMEDPFTVVP